MTMVSFWQSSSKCILPSWKYRITGLPTRFSRLLDALAAHNRHQARTAALIMWRTGLAGLARSSNSSGGTSTTRVVRRRCSSGSRRAVGLARYGCTLTWCSSLRTGRQTGCRGTRWLRWLCGRRCGTSLMGSSGRASTRNRQGLGSDARVPTPCGTVLPGIG